MPFNYPVQGTCFAAEYPDKLFITVMVKECPYNPECTLYHDHTINAYESLQKGQFVLNAI